MRSERKNMRKESEHDYPIHKDVIKRFSKKKVEELYLKLIRKKAGSSKSPPFVQDGFILSGSEKGGDQADMVTRLQAENQYTVQIQRDTFLISQIVKALAKMQSGEYGICEQTGEVIEWNRLNSIPWTNLSIEGAEELENQERLQKIR